MKQIQVPDPQPWIVEIKDPELALTVFGRAPTVDEAFAQAKNILEVETARLKSQADCLHELEPLPPDKLPYRYRCRKCDKWLKIASGVRLP